jgi:hypothetical protein
MHISEHRHIALLRVVQAASDTELQAAHAQLQEKLTDKNIWVAATSRLVLLSRDWPEPPGVAIVSFPDQGTAIRVCDEIGASSVSDPYIPGVMSYSQAIDAANSNRSLLVMVTYNGDTPHYVPVSHVSEI